MQFSSSIISAICIWIKWNFSWNIWRSFTEGAASVYVRTWWYRSNIVTSTRNRIIWCSGIRSFIWEPAIISMITWMSGTQETSQFSFINASIWTRFSSEYRCMFPIFPFFILKIIWWTLGVRMIRACPPSLIFRASQALSNMSTIKLVYINNNLTHPNDHKRQVTPTIMFVSNSQNVWIQKYNLWISWRPNRWLLKCVLFINIHILYELTNFIDIAAGQTYK